MRTAPSGFAPASAGAADPPVPSPRPDVARRHWPQASASTKQANNVSVAALPCRAPRSAAEMVPAATPFTSRTRKLTIHTPPSEAVCATSGVAYCEVPIMPHGYPRNPSDRSQSNTTHAAGSTRNLVPGRARFSDPERRGHERRVLHEGYRRVELQRQQVEGAEPVVDQQRGEHAGARPVEDAPPVRHRVERGEQRHQADPRERRQPLADANEGSASAYSSAEASDRGSAQSPRRSTGRRRPPPAPRASRGHASHARSAISSGP